jgi:catechol 2,3-dioxygenase-like lactoylglutathione lyase family enzyme
MIGYTTLGTNDLPRAIAFYDKLFAEIGVQQIMPFGRGMGWGRSFDQPMFAVMTPFDGQPASVGNGVMVSLQCSTRAQVHALYDSALAQGGTDEGAPGPRGDDFYGAYFRDLDGNKLAAFCVGAPA